MKWSTVRSWGHHTFVYWWIAVFFIDLFMPFFTGIGSASLISITVSLLMISSAVSGSRHRHHLCSWCIRYAPDDPESAVQKDMKWLRRFHNWLTIPSKYDLALLLGLIGFMFLGVFLFNSPFVRWFALPLDAYNIVMLWMLRRHERLQPWCPLCRRGFWEEMGIPDPTIKQEA